MLFISVCFFHENLNGAFYNTLSKNTRRRRPYHDIFFFIKYGVLYTFEAFGFNFVTRIKKVFVFLHLAKVKETWEHNKENVIIPNLKSVWRCPQIGRRNGVKNKEAIVLQCKLNGILISALLFIPYIVVLFEDIAVNKFCLILCRPHFLAMHCLRCFLLEFQKSSHFSICTFDLE